jgi:deazaflavin-dependent oxidoreductase (nitroreductase family)
MPVNNTNTSKVNMSEEIEWNNKLIDEFRANGGKVSGYFTGKTLLLLHTVGTKSGLERVNPVACVRDGERFVIIASNSGSEAHPDWYHNLIANSLVTVEFGTETFTARAAIAKEPERTRLYDKMVAMMPIFDNYRRNATRTIPVIVLTRV